MWVDWEQKARACAAQLWARYEVGKAGCGEKIFRHPAVGTMALNHEVLELVGTEGQRIVVYMATPGTPDHDAMTLLDMDQPLTDPMNRARIS